MEVGWIFCGELAFVEVNECTLDGRGGTGCKKIQINNNNRLINEPCREESK